MNRWNGGTTVDCGVRYESGFVLQPIEPIVEDERSQARSIKQAYETINPMLEKLLALFGIGKNEIPIIILDDVEFEKDYCEKHFRDFMVPPYMIDGFFCVDCDKVWITLRNNTDIFDSLMHEFAHYLHYIFYKRHLAICAVIENDGHNFVFNYFHDLLKGIG